MSITRLHARIAEVATQKYAGNSAVSATDLLVVEEPLEIKVTYYREEKKYTFTLLITMRTPGQDDLLALGFLFAEGIISSLEDVEQVREIPSSGRDKPFTATIEIGLAPQVAFDPQTLERHTFSTSSCGVCGRLNLDHLPAQKPHNDAFRLSPEQILELPKKIGDLQTLFQHTGGLHAAALFNEAGHLIHLSEDVGRHNAMDRLIGYALTTSLPLPLQKHLVLFSGRVSYELMQKSVMAGVSVVASIGAPSSLAVEIAEAYNITLIGFLRGERFNVYAGRERVL